MTGAERIAAERQRQIEVEGWDAAHDAVYVNDELVRVAVAYANVTDESPATFDIPHNWPWHPDWWKPSGDSIRNLEKAGALIAAEIDRLEADRG